MNPNCLVLCYDLSKGGRIPVYASDHLVILEAETKTRVFPVVLQILLSFSLVVHVA